MCFCVRCSYESKTLSTKLKINKFSPPKHIVCTYFVMDEDSYDAFFDEKKQNGGVRMHHRWTDAETIKLLNGVSALLKEPGVEYERPTARKFYEKLKDKYLNDCNLSFVVIKSKMRHLKLSYVKAAEWKDNVGMELYDSDQKHVNARVRSICPHYNLLDEIFGPLENSDPIGFRLPEMNDGDEVSITESLERMSKRTKLNNDESFLVPKIESFNDEHDEDDDETLDTSNTQDFEETCILSRHRDMIPKVTTRSKRCIVQKTNISFEEKKFLLEKKKIQLNYALECRRVSLEERKFHFEKLKFSQMQKLRKYEIDKQYEIKKLEIHSNELIKRLELGKMNDNFNAEVDDSLVDEDIEAQKEFN